MVMDELSPELVKDGLETRFIGQRVLYFPSHSSTMVAARQEVRQMAAEGTVIITGEQTVGRGRAKRVWLSPRGSIALSIVLYPDASQLPYLIMIASVAAAQSTGTVTGPETQLK